MNRLLLCPNAFKGSLDSVEVARAIADGLSSYNQKIQIIELPIADGGDGTMKVLSRYLGGELIPIKSFDALGRELVGVYGYFKNTQTAIVELTAASGIKHLTKEELNPWKANTYGTGVLINHALELSVKEIILTLGGSASVDGGMGILEALGTGFYDREGKRLVGISPQDFSSIHSIDISIPTQKLEGIDFRILCDVENPLLGENGSAKTFAPQKGAKAADVERLEWGLAHLAKIVEVQTGLDIRNIEHGGAAGGISAFLYGLLGAKLMDGANEILDLCGFQQALDQCDVVITGEGMIDRQSLGGKGPGLVARRAKEAGKYVVGLCGKSGLKDVENSPFDEVIEINQPSESLNESIENTSQNLTRVAREWAERLVL